MFKNKKSGALILIVIIVIIGFLAIPVVSLAADAANLIKNPLGTTSIPELVGRLIKAVLGIVGSIALLMFIWGGFLWMTAAGDAKKVEKGRQTLVWATIGLATIFFAYAAVSFVIKSIGANEAEEKGKPPVIREIGFCLRPTDVGGKYTKSDETTSSECESKNYKWVYGACKVGNYYFTTVNKETCDSTAGIWEGEEVEVEEEEVEQEGGGEGGEPPPSLPACNNMYCPPGSGTYTACRCCTSSGMFDTNIGTAEQGQCTVPCQTGAVARGLELTRAAHFICERTP